MESESFKFKKFRIDQAGVAMKVGIDGVLLGAWATTGNGTRGLDIGTGTGLLALMLAQKSKLLKVDAIEIEHTAASMAAKNISESQFFSQINVVCTSLQNFAKSAEGKYDIIISNPPFYSDAIKPPKEERQMARHSDSLSMDELLGNVSCLLSERGTFYFIYPYKELQRVEECMVKKGLYIQKRTVVYPSTQKKAHRILYQVGKKVTMVEESKISIREKDSYSQEFRILTADFYLGLK